MCRVNADKAVTLPRRYEGVALDGGQIHLSLILRPTCWSKGEKGRCGNGMKSALS